MGATSEKVDMKRLYPELYYSGAGARKPNFVSVPDLTYLMIDGTGNPNSSEWFQAAVGALYSVSYGLKFASKEQGKDYSVMPLQALWWADPPESFDPMDRDSWHWTVMILQPEWIDSAMVAKTVSGAVDRGKLGANAADKLRLENLKEGRAAQILHVGPYAEEAPTIRTLHGYVAKHGLSLRGKHHEIYLSDPRRVAPEKMKTLIRHPVE